MYLGSLVILHAWIATSHAWISTSWCSVNVEIWWWKYVFIIFLATGNTVRLRLTWHLGLIPGLKHKRQRSCVKMSFTRLFKQCFDECILLCSNINRSKKEKKSLWSICQQYICHSHTQDVRKRCVNNVNVACANGAHTPSSASFDRETASDHTLGLLSIASCDKMGS